MKLLTHRLLRTVVAGIAVAMAHPAFAAEAIGQAAPRAAGPVIAVPVGAIALSDSQLSGLRGGSGFSDFLNTVLAGLPSQNTVQAQIGQSGPITVSGDGPQTLTLTTPNVQVNLFADNSGTSPPINLTQTYASSVTRGFVQTFSSTF